MAERLTRARSARPARISPIARKNVELILPSGKSKHIPRSEAYHMAKDGRARWDIFGKSMRMDMRSTWRVKQSGYAGPLVMQLQD